VFKRIVIGALNGDGIGYRIDIGWTEYGRRPGRA
jgi:hypothetical protein